MERKSISALGHVVVLLCLMVSTGCQQSRKNQDTSGHKVEDFDKFYMKFHSDSAFQMSRIKFPLEGGAVGYFEDVETSDEEHSLVKWTPENWSMLKGTIYEVDTSQFRTSIARTDSTFVEKIWVENSGESYEYRFKLVDSLWFLVFAEDVNM